MQMLEPIASDVFSSMTQLLDFYVLTIYKHFTRDLVRFSEFYYYDKYFKKAYFWLGSF